MAEFLRSGLSSPRSSTESTSSSSSPVSTPATRSSTLFDTEPVLSFASQAQYEEYTLVVGGLGYIGSHTTWELLKEGFNVIIIDSLDNSYRGVLDNLHTLVNEHFKTSCTKPSIEFYEADYRDQQTLRLILNKYSRPSKSRIEPLGIETNANIPRSSITGVIHFAAYKAVGESIKYPLKYYSNNVGGLVDFCGVLSDFNIKRLIFSSSAAVYGNLEAEHSLRIREERCTHERTSYVDSQGQERTSLGGSTGITNPYGRTKWMCEAILNDLATADPKWTIFALRYFNPVGCDASGMLSESPRGNPQNLLPSVVNVMTGKSPFLNIYGTDWETNDGTAVRDFIHITDLARGHVAALRAAAAPHSQYRFRALNLGTGEGHSVLEVVAAMEKASGRQIPLKKVRRREGDVAKCVADPSRAESELSYRAEKSLATACEDICRVLHIIQGAAGLAEC
ncbi:uncharacterized protein BP5553_09051 [Venustampulla echinocandica]|uniref:UDP-glucose 4-epimerase n=1 Tax=Venustampulla echinocandica TaxID=2656787 RepID=A0A370TDQ3_9HELO|nr:uncharacterized protein BP5553_09051 [Venustampulla echinocandica]RDL32595.1 hypothetical protein BP5553_09051 [Venustampulla echinocandica]